MNDVTRESAGWGDPGEGVLPSSRDVEVRELFVSFGKALRAYQLYEENNPVYQRFLLALREAFLSFWKSQDRLTVAVEESRLVFEDVAVYVNQSRTDSLAFLFYKDGLREVTFLRGIEGEELERLLSVLHRVRHQDDDSDDLLTILWEASLEHFRYQFTDFLAEGVVVPERGSGAEPEQLMNVREQELVPEAVEDQEVEEGEEGGEARSDAPQAVDRESFNPTLYALDPGERAQIEREVQEEMARDLRSDVLSALFDRLEEGGFPERQSEILSDFRTLLPNLLGRGAVDAAGLVLAELRSLDGRADVFDEARREEVRQLLDEVSSPSVIGELVSALEEGSIAPSPRQLGEFLVHLQPQALASLLRASETVAVKELRPVLRKAVVGIAERNRRVLVELVSSSDALVAAGAARLAGSLQISEAAPALQELLKSPHPRARLAAIEAAVTLKASMVAGALQDTLGDPDRAVRIASARALGELRYRPAASRFRALLTGRDVRAADVTEKIAFFEGYGELGDPEAVPLLDRLLNGKGLLGRREAAEMRAAAALALGKVGTPEALRALETARSDEDAVVRSAVNRAVRATNEGPA